MIIDNSFVKSEMYLFVILRSVNYIDNYIF